VTLVSRAEAGWRVVYLGSDDEAKDSSFKAMRESLERLAAARAVVARLDHRLVHARLSKPQQQALAAEVIDRGCDALIAPTADTALAAATALRRPGRRHQPPVLFASFGDPVVMGIVPTSQRPGGRITGVSLTDTWHAKRLELLREAFGPIRTVGVLLDRLWLPVVSYAVDVADPAAALGLHTVRFDADTVEELDTVMHSRAAAGMDAWYIADSYISWLAEARIIEHMRRLRRPAIHTTESEVADGGALMAYAADREFVFDALADLTLRVLRGEDPGSIPIQRPRRFVLAVRPRAEPAALRIHPSVVRRADRVY
jgi:putative tryptophan/tyrosine transport system substrate-binding protein